MLPNIFHANINPQKWHLLINSDTILVTSHILTGIDMNKKLVIITHYFRIARMRFAVYRR